MQMISQAVSGHIDLIDNNQDALQLIAWRIVS